MLRLLLLTLCLGVTHAKLSATTTSPVSKPSHTFIIGDQDFLLDGKPFIIRCGEIHFPRVPREYWQHRLKMCRALGLNTVCVYIFWNFHEWEEGKFNFEGQADVAEFCRLAQQEGLWVILRPGPYSCAEWEMGGLPWWLVKQDGINLRTTDPRFLQPAVRYLKEIARVLAPQQITRGGPLLMVQVENEYGSFGKDTEYMGALRQALLDGGFEVPLFACNPTGAISNGLREDLFQVVNFGAGAAKKAFETLRKYQKTGPLMNGEYYPAWFDIWGRRHRTGPAAPIVADLEYMLSNRHSFSIYMAHGGTSFGLWSGADRPFLPDTSSYDYDAPISEAGWVTPKFNEIRTVFNKHLQPGETLPDAPASNPVVAIPSFNLAESAPLFANLPAAVLDAQPRTIEFYNQSQGVTIYRTTVPAGPACQLSVKEVHDFAWVFLDGRQVGILDRRSRNFSLRLPERSKAARLDFVVEAMGRVNFGKEVFDRKGLHAPVTCQADGDEAFTLSDWSVYAFPLTPASLNSLKYQNLGYKASSQDSEAASPAFWRGSFSLEKTGDTFLDLGSWGKGVVWVNGHCLGRFWNIGPTQTMYLPGPWLRVGRNEVVVLDLLGPSVPRLAGLEKPVLDELHPERDFARSARAKGTFNADSQAPALSTALRADAEWQSLPFPAALKGRYLALEALSSLDGSPIASIAELDATDSNGKVLSKHTWRILWVDSEETVSEAGYAENMLDGQPSTHWQSSSKPGYPHRVVIDFGDSQLVAGIRYLARSGDTTKAGRLNEIRVFVSEKPFGLQ